MLSLCTLIKYFPGTHNAIGIEQIFHTIDQLRHKLGLTIVLVEQNAMSALRIADIGIIINLGKIVATGTATELINDPALHAAYLGY